MVGSGDTFICLISAANGVGKTAAGANIVAHILFGPSGNEYFEGLPLFEKWPYPSKRGRIVSDPTTVQGTLIPELKKWLPPDQYNADKKGKSYEYEWTTKTGWTFDVMTYEQKTKEFEAATLSWAWFDEPPPADIFKATVARMRRGGIIFITATPLTGSAWMYDAIIAKDDEIFGKDLRLGQRDFIYADVEDNCRQHGVRGILEHEHIEKMIAEYDEEDMQARVHGRFQHLVGLVFKKWSRKIHVIKPFQITERDYVVVQALDPHPRVEDAVAWMAIDNKGRKIICDELFISAKTPELARRITKVNDRYRMIEMIADPSAFVEDKHQNAPEQQTLAIQLWNLGLDYQRATKDRTRADRRIKDAIDYTQAPDGSFIVAPELYVFDTCHRVIWEFEHYQWDEWRGQDSSRKTPKEKPLDKDDHMMENIGRLLVQEYSWNPLPKQIYAPAGVGVANKLDPFE